MSVGAVSGDISLRRAVLDWRDWWEIETDQLLTMAAKALILDLTDIHESQPSFPRSLFSDNDAVARIERTITAWAEDITRRVPLAARTELALLLRQEHAPKPVIEKVLEVGFNWVTNPGVVQLTQLAPRGSSGLRDLVADAILGVSRASHWQGQPLRGAMLDHLKRLEAIALRKD